MDYAHTTLDLSHSSTAGQDCVELARKLDSRLTHIHLTDGTGSAKDEHLVPGPWTTYGGPATGRSGHPRRDPGRGPGDLRGEGVRGYVAARRGPGRGRRRGARPPLLRRQGEPVRRGDAVAGRPADDRRPGAGRVP